MKNKNNGIPFTCLVKGKMYETVEKRLGPKFLYVNPFDEYCGYLEINESFIILEKKSMVRGSYHWTKLLTSNGVVGWIPWDITKRFIKVSK